MKSYVYTVEFCYIKDDSITIKNSVVAENSKDAIEISMYYIEDMLGIHHDRLVLSSITKSYDDYRR